ncbi:MAG: T2 family ribonuclease, partial [Acidobacteriota bacterium]
DYDYLMVSKHWLPTMCFGLDAGYDTTLTHQRGDRCVPEAPTRLTLHGLWPNYFNGFPQCCGGGLPLDAVAMAAWPEELRDRLWRAQPDPTVDSFRPALCEIYNHEWQKHGTCFQDTGDIDADARAYFELGLDLFERVADANAQVDAWAGQEQPRAAVEALYPKAIQVLCDRHQPGRLLEIRSCWTRGGEPTDCSPTDGFGPAVSCGDTVELPVWTG